MSNREEDDEDTQIEEDSCLVNNLHLKTMMVYDNLGRDEETSSFRNKKTDTEILSLTTSPRLSQLIVKIVSPSINRVASIFFQSLWMKDKMIRTNRIYHARKKELERLEEERLEQERLES